MTMGYDDPEDERRLELMERMKAGLVGYPKDYYAQRRRALGGPRTYRMDGGKIR